MSFPTPNTDEDLVNGTGPGGERQPFIGNFHKTLPHNRFGEVDPQAYRAFERVCMAVEGGAPINFESVPTGPLVPSVDVPQTDFDVRAKTVTLLHREVAKFTSPLAGASTEILGPDPKTMEMPPAPGCQSISAMAEMAELYWMALLRDVPLLAFQDEKDAPTADCAQLHAHDAALGFDAASRLTAARKTLNTLLDCAVTRDTDKGKLRTPLDLDAGPGGADIDLQHLFRSGLEGEEFGPLVSQFFIRPVGYGVQTIDQ